MIGDHPESYLYQTTYPIIAVWLKDKENIICPEEWNRNISKNQTNQKVFHFHKTELFDSKYT